MWLIVFAATTYTTSTTSATARNLPIASPCWSKSNDSSCLTTNRCHAPYSTPPAVLAWEGGAGADRQVAALSSMYDYNLLHANQSSDLPKPRSLRKCPAISIPHTWLSLRRTLPRMYASRGIAVGTYMMEGGMRTRLSMCS